MSRYLLVHKDHPLRVTGINAGAEMATLHLARFLAKRGEEVYVAAQLVEDEMMLHGVHFWDLGEAYDVEGAIKRIRAIGDYHLISAGRSHPFLFTKDDTQCLSRILISHDRSENDTGINPIVLSHVLDRIVCVSDAQREIFLQAGTEPSLLKTIRNGVDLDLFQAGDTATRDWKKLIFVGALVQDKGLDLLLVSYAELKAKYPALSLDVYGSADLWGREEIYNQQQLESQLPDLKFHGSVSQQEIASALQTAGICVVPSIWFDPFPLTSLEAQVTGCPVVTFNVGGLPEGVRHGETGIVVPEVSDAQLTVALDEILQDESLLRTMSTAAIEKQRPYYTWERVVDEIQKEEADILEERARLRMTSEFSLDDRVGVMTTWNQQCGLATYAKSLVREWLPESYQVFSEYDAGEYAATNIIGEDESFVTRCWSWKERNWESLVHEVIKRNIQVLLVNAHNPKELSIAQFEQAIEALHDNGVQVIVLLHSIFTLRTSSQEVVQAADHIIVHTPEMKLEVSSYGVSPTDISVVHHGVEVLPPIDDVERSNLLNTLNLPMDIPVVSSIGFLQPHKGIESLLEAVRTLADEDIPVHACIAGKVNSESDEARAYVTKLHSLAEYFGISDRVTFIERFLSEDEISGLLQSSQAVVMNYKSDHYECSGACSRAVGAGVNVITSVAPAFQPFGAAVWHSGSGFSVALAIREVLFNPAPQKLLAQERQQYIAANRWSKISSKFLKIAERFKVTKQKEQPVAPQYIHTSHLESNSLRVLIQNRSNMFTQRGGDTIVVEQLIAGLTHRGIQVDLDLEASKDPADYDLVHLINFALPQLVEGLGKRAHEAGTPFIVTTLCEDVPSFHNQSRALAETLIYYTRGSQQSEFLQEHFNDYKGVSASSAFDNSWAAKHAARLVVNGSGEEQVIHSTYPGHVATSIVPVGYELQGEGSKELFIQEYGMEDFILCVGRLESRKNQLMLQLALEQVDIPVVYAAGGFTYQQDYADAVKSFQRKGQTLVLERLSPEMLASAYLAAKVHALPSWYELPGLVSLEAGMLGCNLVAASTGTTKDYLGDYGFYCEADCADSIRNAVLAAYYSPYSEGLAEHIKAFSWEAATEKTLSIYEEVAGKKSLKSPAPVVAVENSIDKEAFDEFARRGFKAAQERNFSQAHDLLGKAEAIDPCGLRVLCNRAAVYLAEENAAEAKQYFERARVVDSTDNKAQSGYAMCLMMEGNKDEAYQHFLEVLDREPTDMMAILQLLDCSYALDRFSELEGVLKRLLKVQPENFDMRYCLTGCLVREDKLVEAESHIQILLSEKPQHGGTLELQQAIKEMLQEQDAVRQGNKMDGSRVSGDTEVEKLVEDKKQNALPVSFDSIDVRLGELEELKHRKDLDRAAAGVEELLERKDLGDHQIKTGELLGAEVQALMGNRDEAKAVFERYHAQDPHCSRSLCGLAAIAASYNDLIEARGLFEEALKNAPLYDKALAGVGFCDFYSGNHSSAWEYYAKSLNANPENLSALLGCIQLAYQLQRLPELEERLEHYLEMHPADLDMVYAYGGCLYAQSRLDEALSEVEKILLFKPEDGRAAELRGVIETKLQDAAVAVS